MTCIVSGCDRPIRNRGLCGRCYQRHNKGQTLDIEPGRSIGKPRPRDTRKKQPLPECPFCAAHLILTNRGYDHDEIAARIHKPPAWLAAHLEKGHTK